MNVNYGLCSPPLPGLHQIPELQHMRPTRACHLRSCQLHGMVSLDTIFLRSRLSSAHTREPVPAY